MTQHANKIHCPTCQKKILYKLDNPARPFCSDRCKLIDLGQWAEEKHLIPGDPTIVSVDKDDLN